MIWMSEFFLYLPSLLLATNHTATMKFLHITILTCLIIGNIALTIRESGKSPQMKIESGDEMDKMEGEKLEGSESAYIPYYGFPYYPYSIYKPYLHHHYPVVYVGK